MSALKTVKARFVNAETIKRIKEFEVANPTIPFENWVAGLAEHVLAQMGKHEDFDISKWQVFITNPDMIRKAMVQERERVQLPDTRLSVMHGGKEIKVPDSGRSPGKTIGKPRLKLVKEDAETELLGEGAGEAETERSGEEAGSGEGEQEAGEADRG